MSQDWLNWPTPYSSQLHSPPLSLFLSLSLCLSLSLSLCLFLSLAHSHSVLISFFLSPWMMLHSHSAAAVCITISPCTCTSIYMWVGYLLLKYIWHFVQQTHLAGCPFVCWIKKVAPAASFLCCSSLPPSFASYLWITHDKNRCLLVMYLLLMAAFSSSSI